MIQNPDLTFFIFLTKDLNFTKYHLYIKEKIGLQSEYYLFKVLLKESMFKIWKILMIGVSGNYKIASV